MSEFKEKPGMGKPKVRPSDDLRPKQAARQMTAKTGRAAKTVLTEAKRLSAAVTRAVAALFSSFTGLAGGAVLLIALVIVIAIAAVINSPFCLFFTDEKNALDTISVSEAVAQVHMAFNDKLEELQTGDYGSIVLEGQAPEWSEVLAVFAVKLAGDDTDGADVATLDADRVEKLTAVFWDMTEITAYTEAADHLNDDDVEEYILHIAIAARTADDMRTTSKGCGGGLYYNTTASYGLFSLKNNSICE